MILQLVNYDLDVQYGLNNEIETEDMEDKDAFFKLINMFLWNEPHQNDNQERQYYRQGILGRPMPMIIRRQDNFSGSMYRSFVDQCYSLVCKLGLNGMFKSLERLIS